MATRLSVNLNAVAMLRNRRDLAWPSVTGIGRLALQAGAHGLTVHPRPDERHIRRSDVFDVAELIANEFTDKEFNIEGYPSHGRKSPARGHPVQESLDRGAPRR